MRINSSLVIFLCFVLFVTCKRDENIAPINMGYEYFPLEPGQWHIYQVDSFVYKANNASVDTFHYQYQVKELISEIFIDNSGHEVYKIERYKRASDSLMWQISDIWTTTIENNKAIKSEENVRFIKLIFPVKENNKWDGNAYNTMDAQEYIYESIDIPRSFDNFTFDATIHVVQNDFITLISENYADEFYALNVGLYYKSFIYIEKELNQNIKSGYKYYYYLKDFGK